MTRRAEILALTGLRAVAAYWVVAFHFVRADSRVPVLSAVIGDGYIAVDLFFVLSGFVLAERYAETSLSLWPERRTFWKRRLARVYPLYIVSLAIGFYAEWPRSGADLGTAGGVSRLFGQLALLNAFSHRWMFRLNWPAWSLSVEAFFYAVFPWLHAGLLRVSRRAMLWVLLVSCLLPLLAPLAYTILDPDHLGRWLEPGDQMLWSFYLKFSPLPRLPMFVAGMAAARWGGTLPRIFAPLSLALLVLALSLGIVPFVFLQGGALLPVFVILILALASPDAKDSLGQRWLSSRPAVLLGHASYATYILHVPLYEALARSGASTVLTQGYLLALVPVSVLAWRLVEEPLRKLLTVTRSSPG
jgi:peptidoglycan/LPS O-acetylase OafA/YrhL